MNIFHALGYSAAKYKLTSAFDKIFLLLYILTSSLISISSPFRSVTSPTLKPRSYPSEILNWYFELSVTKIIFSISPHDINMRNFLFLFINFKSIFCKSFNTLASKLAWFYPKYYPHTMDNKSLHNIQEIVTMIIYISNKKIVM